MLDMRFAYKSLNMPNIINWRPLKYWFRPVVSTLFTLAERQNFLLLRTGKTFYSCGPAKLFTLVDRQNLSKINVHGPATKYHSEIEQL